MTLINAHMNVFSPPLSPDNFSFPALSVLTLRSHLLGSQRSTLPLSLSFRSPLPSFQLCCQLLRRSSHSTGKELALIPHTAPRNSACSLCCCWTSQLWRDKKNCRQTDRQTDRNGKCIHYYEHTSPEEQLQCERQNICVHTIITVCLCACACLCGCVHVQSDPVISLRVMLEREHEAQRPSNAISQ